MVTQVPSTDLLDHAIESLMRQWQISPTRAAMALLAAAEELGIAVGDLAALVSASELQHRSVPTAPDRPRTPRLAVVGRSAGPAPAAPAHASAAEPHGWQLRPPSDTPDRRWSTEPREPADEKAGVAL